MALSYDNSVVGFCSLCPPICYAFRFLLLLHLIVHALYIFFLTASSAVWSFFQLTSRILLLHGEFGDLV